MSIPLDPARMNPDGLALSGQYADTMNGTILPYLDSIRADTTIAGQGGAPLFVSRFDAESPRGTAMVVHGFTENADKFAELIFSLLSRRISVVAYDQRGHGRSWRASGLDGPSLTHVDRFSDYVRDMELVVDTTLVRMPRPWVLFAHSMGGAVSSLYMEAHPDTFARAVLCAPMIAPHLHGIPAPIGKLICGVPKLLGKGKQRMFISRPYAYPDDFATSCATDQARFDWYETRRRDDARFSNNGPTYGWTLEAIRVTAKILAPGEVERIATPVRVYGAESDDQVLPKPQERFVRRLRQGTRTVVKGSKHEIYRSTDDVLFPWWHEILEFYEEAMA